jgi:hypothetical protein
LQRIMIERALLSFRHVLRIREPGPQQIFFSPRI